LRARERAELIFDFDARALAASTEKDEKEMTYE
jgi:hypothetical protein